MTPCAALTWIVCPVWCRACTGGGIRDFVGSSIPALRRTPATRLRRSRRARSCFHRPVRFIAEFRFPPAPVRAARSPAASRRPLRHSYRPAAEPATTAALRIRTSTCARSGVASRNSSCPPNLVFSPGLASPVTCAGVTSGTIPRRQEAPVRLAPPYTRSASAASGASGGSARTYSVFSLAPGASGGASSGSTSLKAGVCTRLSARSSEKNAVLGGSPVSSLRPFRAA